MNKKFKSFEKDGKRVIERTVYPCFNISVIDDCNDSELSNALKKAAEFILKGSQIK